MTSRILRHFCLAIASACFAASAAHADIAAFNAAVTKGDYKAAAAEAASTWPTLDKTRADIRVIAGEFGFMSYIAGDYASARKFSDFATTAVDGAPANPQHLVLLRLSEMKLDPSDATRAKLAAAVTERVNDPSADTISFLASDALVKRDFSLARWQDVQESAALGIKLTSAAGADYALENRQYQLFDIVAEFMIWHDVKSWDRLRALDDLIKADIRDAATDEAARRFVPLDHMVSAWFETVDVSIRGQDVNMRPRDAALKAVAEARKTLRQSDRFRALFDVHLDLDSCQRVSIESTRVQYPYSAAFRKLIGAVILHVDIDENGAVSNPQILAAVPSKPFGDAILENITRMRYRPGKKWSENCSLAEKGHVIIYRFQVPG